MINISNLFKRFTKIFTGEVSISGMHFVLSIVLLKHLNLSDYGFVSMIFLLGGIVYAYINGISSSPLSVYSPRTSSKRVQMRYEVIFGSTSCFVILAVFVLAIPSIWYLQKDWLITLLASLLVALFGARALTRGMFFARGMESKAIISDFAYAVSGLNFICIILLQPSLITIKTALLMIIVPQIVSIIISFVIKGEKIRLSFRARDIKTYQKLALKPALWDSLTTTISFAVSHTQSFVVAAIFGSAAYAPLAAGLVLFGPFRTVTMALGNTLRPDFSRSMKNKDHKLTLGSLLFGLASMTALSLGFLIFIWLFWNYIYQFLFAAKFSNVSIEMIVFLNGIAALFYTNANVLQFYLQAKLQNEAIAFARMIGAIAAILSIFPLLLILPVAYSVFSLILAEAVSFFYLAYIVYRDVILRVKNMPNNIANTK